MTKWLIKYEAHGQKHEGSAEIVGGDRLHVWTPHGSDRHPVYERTEPLGLITFAVVTCLGLRLISIEPGSAI